MPSYHLLDLTNKLPNEFIVRYTVTTPKSVRTIKTNTYEDMIKATKNNPLFKFAYEECLRIVGLGADKLYYEEFNNRKLRSSRHEPK